MYLCRKKKTHMKFPICYLLLALLVACNKNQDVITEINRIKILGDTNPSAALAAYDSLSTNMENVSTRNQRTYELLGVRLNDKNDRIPRSDSIVKVLVDYYESNGSNMELQEAYYYAGSVYRDLGDIPRSLDYFLKSSERAEYGDVDSLLLRNCFSQLYLSYFKVQNYKESLQAALMECRIAEGLGVLDDLSLIHLSNNYLRLGEDSLALNVMTQILGHQKSTEPQKRDKGILSDLLYSFSALLKTEQASECYRLLKETGGSKDMSYEIMLNMAIYYQAVGNMKSCVSCYKNVLKYGNMECKYGASKSLYQIYSNAGLEDSASVYAAKFIDISTLLDLGARQELAATANNQYKYYKNKLDEERIIYERNNYRLRMYLYVGGIILIIIIGSSLHFWRKTCRLKTLIAFNDSFDETHNCIQQKRFGLSDEEQVINAIRKSIEHNKAELSETRSEMKKTLEEALQMRNTLRQVQKENFAKNVELADVEKRLRQQKDLINGFINKLTLANNKLEQFEKELAEKDIKLLTKMEQNRLLFMAQHQVALERNAPDLLKAIKDSSMKTDGISNLDWKEFMTVIDELYPNFSKSLLDKLGIIKTKQTYVCYLLKAGFRNTEIEYIIKDVSRSTIWRWIKIYRETLMDDINE